jgi:hypothetical protein
VGQEGLAKTPTTAVETSPTPLGWDAIGEFLGASEAMGRLGAALADGEAGWLGERRTELKPALQDALARLHRLAEMTGIDLQEGP